MAREGTAEEKIAAMASSRDSTGLADSLSDPVFIESFARQKVSEHALYRLENMHLTLGGGGHLEKHDIAFLISLCAQLAEDNITMRRRWAETIGATLKQGLMEQLQTSSSHWNLRHP